MDILLDHVVLEATSDQTLDRIQGVLRVGDRLTLGGLTDQHFIVGRERHDGRRGASAFGILDHARLAAFEDGHAGIGRAQVDADDS